MFIPLAGLISSVILFSIVGLIVFLIWQRSLPSLLQLAIFVAGACPGFVASAVLYGLTFADENNQLSSLGSAYGFYPFVVAGGALAGYNLVRLSVGMRAKNSPADEKLE